MNHGDFIFNKTSTMTYWYNDVDRTLVVYSGLWCTYYWFEIFLSNP